MRVNIFRLFISIFGVLLMLTTGCSAYLVSQEIGSEDEADQALTMKDPYGIPWVESRKYAVYVFYKKRCTDKKETEARTTSITGETFYDHAKYARRDQDLVYFDVVSLTDKVNGQIIDPERPRWRLNYQTLPFGSGDINLEFHGSGSLKKASINAETGATAAADTAKEAASFEKKRMTEKKELLELRNAINEAEKNLQPTPPAID